MKNKLKVYVACAIRDVPQDRKESFLGYVNRSKSRLRKIGVEVLDFVMPEDVECTNIYVHDMQQVEKADMLIVICDIGSIGAGIEFEHAVQSKKPILVVSGGITHKMLSDAAKVHKFIKCRSNVSNMGGLIRAFHDATQEFDFVDRF